MSQNLLDSGLRRAQIRRSGDVTLIVFDGLGAVATDALGFRGAQRWAQSRIASGNPTRDRTSVLERLETAIVRTGTAVTTTHGTARGIATLAKAMKQAGFNLKDWSIPKAVLEDIDARPDMSGRQSRDDDEPETPPEDDDTPEPIAVDPRRDRLDRDGIDRSLD